MRPRSWWSCSRPKRSASSMTITVALGTSTPTSMTVVATSTSVSPLAERAHRRLLLGGGHLAVQQPEAQPGELLVLQPLELLGGRTRLELVGSLDQRADDVRLPALGDLARAPARTRPRVRAVPRPRRSSRSASARPGGDAARSCRGRRRSASPRCAGSAWPSSPARRASRPCRAAGRAARRRSGAARRSPRRRGARTRRRRRSSAWVPTRMSTVAGAETVGDATPFGRRGAVGEERDAHRSLAEQRALVDHRQLPEQRRAS